jgi:hypothetical protein
MIVSERSIDCSFGFLVTNRWMFVMKAAEIQLTNEYVYFYRLIGEAIGNIAD